MNKEMLYLSKIGKWLITISTIAFFTLLFLHANSKMDFGSLEAQELATIFMEELMIGYMVFPIYFLIGLWFFLDSENIIKFRDKIFAKGEEK